MSLSRPPPQDLQSPQCRLRLERVGLGLRLGAGEAHLGPTVFISLLLTFWGCGQREGPQLLAAAEALKKPEVVTLQALFLSVSQEVSSQSGGRGGGMMEGGARRGGLGQLLWSHLSTAESVSYTHLTLPTKA